MESTDINHHVYKLFSALEHAMRPCSNNKKRDANKHVYFIREGQAIVLLDGAVFATVAAPSFIGLINIFQTEIPVIQEVIFSDNSIAYKISSSQVKKELEKTNAYDSIAFLISKNSLSFVNYILQLKNRNTYNVIRNAIYYYDKNKSNLHHYFSLSKFIIEFTGVSKSRAMLILQELKKGNYIETTANGRLIKVNNLPSEF